MNENENIKVGYVLPQNIVDCIDRIAAIRRWNKSVVVEVAIEELYQKVFSTPNDIPLAEAIQASEAANATA